LAEVQLRGLRKSYGAAEVIRGVDLDIRDGEFVVFVGPSGCGKSTLLRMIAGLEDITAGDLLIGGRLCNEVPPKERGVAMVFQSYALYPHKTVFGNLSFNLRISRVPRDEIRRKVTDAARILEIEHLLDRRPAQLSGGQRQRVAIGRAIVRQPQMFLFDEPLSNLDAGLRVNMRMEIARLHQQLGATMIYVTHDQVEAMTLADRIVVMDAGKARQVGTPMELYNAPVDRFVAAFIGSPRMNFLDVEVDAADANGVKVSAKGIRPIVVPVQGAATLAGGTRLTLGVRPEHVVSHQKPVAAGTVAVVERLGSHVQLGIRLEDHGLIVAQAAANDAARLGDPRDLGFVEEALHLFDADGAALRRARPET
jgi:multiple sugar transport system ATP-binding protein